MDLIRYLKHFTEHLDKCKNNIQDKETMDTYIRRTILRDYSYDVVDYLKVTTTHEK